MGCAARVRYLSEVARHSPTPCLAVTGPNCPACRVLKGSVNEGTEVRALMDKFDVVYDDK